MTPQQIFDIAAKHMMAQAKRSQALDEPAYRGEDGLMCGIGALIPDDVYDKGMESYTVVKNMARFPKMAAALGEMTAEKVSLLIGIQVTHDYRDPDDWAEYLREVAALHHVDSSVLPK